MSDRVGQSEGSTRKPRLGPREHNGKCVFPACDHMGYGRPDKCICRKWERQNEAIAQTSLTASVSATPEGSQRGRSEA